MLLPCELQIKVKGMLNPSGAQSTHVDKTASSLRFYLGDDPPAALPDAAARNAWQLVEASLDPCNTVH